MNNSIIVKKELCGAPQGRQNSGMRRARWSCEDGGTLREWEKKEGAPTKRKKIRREAIVYDFCHYKSGVWCRGRVCRLCQCWMWCRTNNDGTDNSHSRNGAVVFKVAAENEETRPLLPHLPLFPSSYFSSSPSLLLPLHTLILDGAVCLWDVSGDGWSRCGKDVGMREREEGAAKQRQQLT